MQVTRVTRDYTVYRLQGFKRDAELSLTLYLRPGLGREIFRRRLGSARARRGGARRGMCNI